MSRRLARPTQQGLLVVISSPSGGGKSTVIRELRRRHREFLYSVSVTTRARRKGERNGVHYRFVSEAEFRQLREHRGLVESAKVHDDYYGTPRRNLELALKRKAVMMFDLDVQGAAQLRKSRYPLVTIFLWPPSVSEWHRRLAGRGSETAAQLKRRYQSARDELKRASEYEYWVTNGRLTEAVADCESIIRAERLRNTGT